MSSDLVAEEWAHVWDGIRAARQWGTPFPVHLYRRHDGEMKMTVQRALTLSLDVLICEMGHSPLQEEQMQGCVVQMHAVRLEQGLGRIQPCGCQWPLMAVTCLLRFVLWSVFSSCSERKSWPLISRVFWVILASRCGTGADGRKGPTGPTAIPLGVSTAG